MWTSPRLAAVVRHRPTTALLYFWALDAADAAGRLTVGEVIGMADRIGVDHRCLQEEGLGLLYQQTDGTWLYQIAGLARREAETACPRRQPRTAPPPDAITVFELEHGSCDIPKTSSVEEQVREVFAGWLQETGRDAGRTKLTDDRRRAVAKCLRAGYSPTDILAAVKGVRSSAFHMGKGSGREGRPLDDLTDVCRQPARIEQWAALQDRPDADAGADVARERTREMLSRRRKGLVP